MIQTCLVRAADITSCHFWENSQMTTCQDNLFVRNLVRLIYRRLPTLSIDHQKRRLKNMNSYSRSNVPNRNLLKYKSNTSVFTRHHAYQRPNAQPLVIFLKKKTHSPRKRSKIGEWPAIAYGFLRLWYKCELRRYSHYIIFIFRAID